MCDYDYMQHGTCPACRHVFLDIRQRDESDSESSDGDYVPGEDDEEEAYTDEDIEWTSDSEPLSDSTDLEEDEVDTEYTGRRLEDVNVPTENFGLSQGSDSPPEDGDSFGKNDPISL
jgi:hypothetical protein